MKAEKTQVTHLPSSWIVQKQFLMNWILAFVMGMSFGIAATIVSLRKYLTTSLVAKSNMAEMSGIQFLSQKQILWLNEKLKEYWLGSLNNNEEEACKMLRHMEMRDIPRIKAIKIRKVSLGQVAPRLEGICIKSLHDKKITVDFRIEWRGNLLILFDVETKIATNPVIQLKISEVFTGVRVICKVIETNRSVPNCISPDSICMSPEIKPRFVYSLHITEETERAISNIPSLWAKLDARSVIAAVKSSFYVAYMGFETWSGLSQQNVEWLNVKL